MSDAPPPMDVNNEPTRSGDMTPPMQQGQAPSELPRQGYDSGGRCISPFCPSPCSWLSATANSGLSPPS